MADYKVIRSEELSDKYEPRYIVVDAENGKILDDAQGYGYRSVQKAHAGYSYKSRPRKEKSAIAKTKRVVKKWADEHRDFMDDVESAMFHVAKGSYGPNATFTKDDVDKMLRDEGYADLPFTAAELLKYGL